MALVLLLASAFYTFVGGPVSLLYTVFDHVGSKAWDFRSYSTLGEGDHFAKVCDWNPGYTEYVIVGVKGKNIRHKDPDGWGGRCGYRRFDKEGRWHKTCSGNQCGGTSQHQGRRRKEDILERLGLVWII